MNVNRVIAWMGLIVNDIRIPRITSKIYPHECGHTNIIFSYSHDRDQDFLDDAVDYILQEEDIPLEDCILASSLHMSVHSGFISGAITVRNSFAREQKEAITSFLTSLEPKRWSADLINTCVGSPESYGAEGELKVTSFSFNIPVHKSKQSPAATLERGNFLGTDVGEVKLIHHSPIGI